MRYVYFTKSLQALTVEQMAGFLKGAGLDGADLAVRPGYAVHPDNALSELPGAAKIFRDHGLAIGLVTAPTDLINAESIVARNLFNGCARAGVPAIKIGYFQYNGKFDSGLIEARARLNGFSKLAASSGVRACYHTHSGNMYGSNGAGLRLLLNDLDPHHIGAFVDTGHTAIGGGPIGMELDMVRSWLSLLAIKDIAWKNKGHSWQHQVVPAGQGIVQWNEVGKAIKAMRYDGTISLHGEYEAPDLEGRREMAKQELLFLKKYIV